VVLVSRKALALDERIALREPQIGFDHFAD
jgi:hypothetical protein